MILADKTKIAVWPDDQIVLSIFGHLQKWKYDQKHTNCAKVGSKTLPKTKLTLKILPKIFTYLLKWWNFSKSGHTESKMKELYASPYLIQINKNRDPPFRRCWILIVRLLPTMYQLICKWNYNPRIIIFYKRFAGLNITNPPLELSLNFCACFAQRRRRRPVLCAFLQLLQLPGPREIM